MRIDEQFEPKSQSEERLESGPGDQQCQRQTLINVLYFLNIWKVGSKQTRCAENDIRITYYITDLYKILHGCKYSESDV